MPTTDELRHEGLTPEGARDGIVELLLANRWLHRPPNTKDRALEKSGFVLIKPILNSRDWTVALTHDGVNYYRGV